MPNTASELERLALALADGTPVDWDEAEAVVSTPDDRLRVRRLKLLARIASVYRDPVHGASAGATNIASRPTPASRSHIPVPLPPGTNWGPLEVDSRIGLGSFGEVYRARDLRLDRVVALKLLRYPERPMRSAAWSAVVEEGRLLARVRHPNVASVFGADRIDGRVGIWMELVDGRTLDDELQDRGPFAVEEVVHIGLDLCRALGAVHDAGLLHRDVKPQNVMRDAASGRIVLMDFSAGREVAELAADAGGLPASIAGSPLFLAPEVLAGAPATEQSDIYSLGVLLFRLLTGSSPVQGATVRDILDAHATGRRSRVADLRQGLPLAVAAIVDRATAAVPAERFAHAREMEEALAGALRPRPRRAFPLALAGAMAAVLLAVALGQYVARTRPSAHTAAPSEETGPGTVTLRQLVFDPKLGVNLRAPADDGEHATCNAGGALAICNLRTGDAQRLRVPASYQEGPSNSVLSPDGRTVAYIWTERGSPVLQTLRLVASDGSSDRSLYVPARDHWITVLKWTRDGRGLLVLTGVGTTDRRYALVRADTGAVTTVRQLNAETDGTPDLSPDERYLVFARARTPDTTGDLRLVDLRSGSERWLEPHSADDSAPHWTPDGRSIVFVSERLGTRALFLLPMRDGNAAGDARPIRDMGRSTMQILGFSHAGAMLLRVVTGWSDVVRARVRLEDATVSDVSRVDASSLDENSGPDWSPDGRRVAYVSGPITGSKPGHVVVRTADGRLDHEVILPGSYARLSRARWAPDGRALAVTYDTDGGMALDLVTLATDARRRLRVQQAIREVRWEPDGASLLYTDDTAIRRLDLHTGRVTTAYEDPTAPMVSYAGFDLARRDGSLALVVEPQHPGAAPTRVVRVVTRDGKAFDRYQCPGACAAVGWSHDATRLLVSASDALANGASVLLVLDRDAGAARMLLPRVQDANDIALSPGDHDLIVGSGNPRPEFWLVSGFSVW